MAKIVIGDLNFKMSLRLAIGSCRCRDGMLSSNPKVRELCFRITARLEALKALPNYALVSAAPYKQEIERIDGQAVMLSTYKDELENETFLIVIQGFLPSWRFPKYFGPCGVGHMFAEGFIVETDGKLKEPDEELLWFYR